MDKQAFNLSKPRPVSTIPRTTHVRHRTQIDSRLAGADTTVALPNRTRLEMAIVGSILGFVFLWANWSSLIELIEIWDREPDYSHGFLVAPVAAIFLWCRRDRFPHVRSVPGWAGFALLGMSILLAIAGRRYSLSPVVYWAMIAWIGGVVWIVGGRQVFGWALPAIAFLIFMVPLPYRMEGMLSGPLQRIATVFSCWTLQLFGQPAFAEGNTIFLGATQLEVEHACSGLRMLVMITALAAACAVLVCRNWPERYFLMFCILPVAMLANCVRIVATGLAYQYLSNEAFKTISHDVAGWIVVPVAAAAMGLSLLYWRRLFVESNQVLLVSHAKLPSANGSRSSTSAY